MTSLPRALVATALGIDETALPPGDLPLDRLAARFLAFLAATAEDDAPERHPEAWTHALLETLAKDHPEHGLAAIRATLAACDSPVAVALVAAGPLETLVHENGAAVIDEIEALAARAPRFAYALTGVWPPETGAHPLLWARIEAARRDAPALDDAAPLPPATGLA